MIHQLTHDEASAAVDAVALDALEGTERIAVLTHIEGCEICKAELESVRSTLANLAFSTSLAGDTPRPSRSRIRQRLIQRAAPEPAPKPVMRATPAPIALPVAPVAPKSDKPEKLEKFERLEKFEKPEKVEKTEKPEKIENLEPVAASNGSRSAKQLVPLPPLRVLDWAGLAAGILFAASVGVIGAMWQERGRLHEAIDNESTRSLATRDSLRIALSTRDSLLSGLTGRDVTIMTLTSNTAKPTQARIFWDPTKNTWTLLARDLPPLKSGRTYQLWLLTRNAKVSAGTFGERNGDAILRATYTLQSADHLRGIAVTEEAAGGATQPTGTPVIATTR